MYNIPQKVENIVHLLRNFFFCHYVLEKSSAAEASESVYMRERVKVSARIIENAIETYKISLQIYNEMLLEILYDRIIKFVWL